jgi:hypothetical protein
VSSPAAAAKSAVVPANVAQPNAANTTTVDANKVLAALPLGGRIKMDPWNDELTMLKAKPVNIVAEREKMPFEVTPFVVYLTREQSRTMQQTAPAAAAETHLPAAAAPTREAPAVAAESNNDTVVDPVTPDADAK